MSQAAEVAAAEPIRGRRPWWILLALLLGLFAGAFAQGLGDEFREPAVQTAAMIGGLWLDALKMTVIPLIVALLVTGIAKGAEAARAGRITGRAISWFLAVYISSAVFGALAMPFLLGVFPLPESGAAALRAGLATLDPAAISASVPGAADFFRAIIPPNVVAAASNGDILQLVVFSLLFALAISQLPNERRRPLLALFEALADALLVVIRWVLWIAPLGVFGLAFALGAGAGGAALGAVLHYVLLISAIGLTFMLAGYAIAVLVGGIGPVVFAKGMIAPQAVAISTQSSLASLPAMLSAARLMGVRQRIADVTLPLAVALFRATGPAMNIGVVLYIAHWLGLELGLAQIAAGVAVGAVASIGSPSLPGQISFLTAIAPIAMAMGVPIAPLALLVAVENIPDIFRTVGNVTLDVAVTTAVDRSTGDADDQASDDPLP